MTLQKKKVLAVFLEKDNLKFLVYTGKLRSFAGQITFAPEVVRDGFIADSEKFSAQVKIAFAQKATLHEVTQVLLFISPDKAFTKTMPASESLDSFVHGLPYFKEELLITSTENKDKTITYVAFEKKLVEDLQRPFLDVGKKVLAVKSPANVLTRRFAQVGKYLLLVPLEKEVIAIIGQDGNVADLSVIKNEVFAARLLEFKSAHEITTNSVYTLGVFPSSLSANLNLHLVSLAQTDVYDLIVNSSSDAKSLNIPQINQKYVFLAGAVLVGVVLTAVIVKNFPRSQSKVISPVTQPAKPITPVVVEPKTSDFPVAIYNGTLVTGEAGKLAEVLKAQGFPITDTKNATSAGFAATRLRVTSSIPASITSGLEKTLLETYESVSKEFVATISGTAKIEIIIGKKKWTKK